MERALYGERRAGCDDPDAAARSIFDSKYREQARGVHVVRISILDRAPYPVSRPSRDGTEAA